MTISMDIVKYFRNNAELIQQGQGNITISCPRLWEMSDTEFLDTFVNHAKSEGGKNGR